MDGEVITHKYNTTSAVGLGNPPLAGHELAHPGVGPTVVEGEVVTHKYYQWVCVTLLLQGMSCLTLGWDQQWWRVRWSPTSTTSRSD